MLFRAVFLLFLLFFCCFRAVFLLCVCLLKLSSCFYCSADGISGGKILHGWVIRNGAI